MTAPATEEAMASKASKGVRSKGAKSASDRATESRAAKLAAGYVAKSWLLPPAAAADLAALIERDGCSETEAVTRALRVARDRHAEPSNAELAAMVARRLKGSKEGR
jgi:hypothetical protein